jgi:hypothetical protein
VYVNGYQIAGDAWPRKTSMPRSRSCSAGSAKFASFRSKILRSPASMRAHESNQCGAQLWVGTEMRTTKPGAISKPSKSSSSTTRSKPSCRNLRAQRFLWKRPVKTTVSFGKLTEEPRVVVVRVLVRDVDRIGTEQLRKAACGVFGVLEPARVVGAARREPRVAQQQASSVLDGDAGVAQELDRGHFVAPANGEASPRTSI